MKEAVVTQYQVRSLNAKDLFKMTKILSVISGELRDSLKDVDFEKVDSQFLGIIIVEAAMKHAETQLKEFLADLVGMTPEEFEQEPFDAPITILTTLAEQEDLKAFFTKAKGLMKVFTGK